MIMPRRSIFLRRRKEHDYAAAQLFAGMKLLRRRAVVCRDEVAAAL